MDKLEKKINIIRNKLNRCITSMYTCYTYGNIPYDKCRNAINAYAIGAQNEEVIGLIDETLFGSGRRGMLFTENGVYYTTSSGNRFYKYSDRVQFNWSSSSGYINSCLNAMMIELYNADKTSIIEKIDKLPDQVAFWDEKIKIWKETFETLGDLWNSITNSDNDKDNS